MVYMHVRGNHSNIIKIWELLLTTVVKYGNILKAACIGGILLGQLYCH